MIERIDKLNKEALRLTAKGEYPEAIACFNRAILLNKYNPIIWYNLGVTYRNSGDLINARDSFRQALEFDRRNPDIIEALATVYIQLKNKEEISHYATYGLEIDDSNPRFWNLKGVSYFQSENYTQAAESFEKALCYNPYYLDALYNLKDTYEELDNKIGVNECTKRIREIL